MGTGAGASMPDAVALGERLKQRGGSKVGAYQVPAHHGLVADRQFGSPVPHSRALVLRDVGLFHVGACLDARPGPDPQRATGSRVCRRRRRRQHDLRLGLRRDERPVRARTTTSHTGRRDLWTRTATALFSRAARRSWCWRKWRSPWPAARRSGRSSKGPRRRATAKTWSFPTARARKPP